jgi:hypothetical protein
MDMDKTQKEKAEKLQAKLDKLLETREKKQAAFDKTKRELSAVTKEIDGVKLKLFEILQSGSDDSAFSSWAKRKINEKSENGKTADSEKIETPVSHNQQTHTGQNPRIHTAQIVSSPDKRSDS